MSLNSEMRQTNEAAKEYKRPSKRQIKGLEKKRAKNKFKQLISFGRKK